MEATEELEAARRLGGGGERRQRQQGEDADRAWHRCRIA